MDFSSPPADVIAHMRAAADAQTDPERHDLAMLLLNFFTDPNFRESVAGTVYANRVE